MQDIIDRQYVKHGDTLHSRLVMSTSIRTAILERNQRLRNAPDTLNDLSFGRVALSIPELDHYHLLKKYPDLGSNDREIKQRALAKFMASPESEPYKVR